MIFFLFFIQNIDCGYFLERPSYVLLHTVIPCEPRLQKTGLLPMQKQRRRSASQ